MKCPCEKLAGQSIEVSPICIGHLWIFRDLQRGELEALIGSALKNRASRGESLFS